MYNCLKKIHKNLNKKRTMNMIPYVLGIKSPYTSWYAIKINSSILELRSS